MKCTQNVEKAERMLYKCLQKVKLALQGAMCNALAYTIYDLSLTKLNLKP